jgi:hypothetical protein
LYQCSYILQIQQEISHGLNSFRQMNDHQLIFIRDRQSERLILDTIELINVLMNQANGLINDSIAVNLSDDFDIIRITLNHSMTVMTTMTQQCAHHRQVLLTFHQNHSFIESIDCDEVNNNLYRFQSLIQTNISTELLSRVHTLLMTSALNCLQDAFHLSNALINAPQFFPSERFPLDQHLTLLAPYYIPIIVPVIRSVLTELKNYLFGL